MSLYVQLQLQLLEQKQILKVDEKISFFLFQQLLEVSYMGFLEPYVLHGGKLSARSCSEDLSS